MSTMDINEIQQYLPHRYPFLLVDRVLECKPGEYIVAIKNVTFNEPFFTGHFPKLPIMPGVLIIEAMAQAAALLAYKTAGRLPSDDAMVYFLGIDEARFKNPVTPGDQLVFTARIERNIKNVWKFVADAKVDGKLVAEAKMMCSVKEP
jgi:3-hydroxyacyl-[acyl-carrier-protein] dehydratase